MDVRSFKIANLLLDNPENEAVLEFTLMGPTLEFTSETIISITGGDFRPQINGKPAKMYTAIYMHRGDILTSVDLKAVNSKMKIISDSEQNEDIFHTIYQEVWI